MCLAKFRDLAPMAYTDIERSWEGLKENYYKPQVQKVKVCMCGSETWAMKTGDMQREPRERWSVICGVTFKDRISNMEMNSCFDVEAVSDVVRRSRLRWFILIFIHHATPFLFTIQLVPCLRVNHLQVFTYERTFQGTPNNLISYQNIKYKFYRKRLDMWNFVDLFLLFFGHTSPLTVQCDWVLIAAWSVNTAMDLYCYFVHLIIIF